MSRIWRLTTFFEKAPSRPEVMRWTATGILFAPGFGGVREAPDNIFSIAAMEARSGEGVAQGPWKPVTRALEIPWRGSAGDPRFWDPRGATRLAARMIEPSRALLCIRSPFDPMPSRFLHDDKEKIPLEDYRTGTRYNP